MNAKDQEFGTLTLAVTRCSRSTTISVEIFFLATVLKFDLNFYQLKNQKGKLNKSMLLNPLFYTVFKISTSCVTLKPLSKQLQSKLLHKD